MLKYNKFPDKYEITINKIMKADTGMIKAIKKTPINEIIAIIVIIKTTLKLTTKTTIIGSKKSKKAL